MSRTVTARAQGTPASATSAAPRASGGRESVESFVFVFLFFLVLGVEAEGFVIPTGSMAPTLMGRHKEVTCPECGATYEVNADREVSDAAPTRAAARWVVAGTCVNCRFQADIADEPNFQGDRIYVVKTGLSLPFSPQLGTTALRRWQTAVFKLPEEPEVRYIKRTVGMPGEVLRILRGDVWTRPLGSDLPFRRQLRPLRHQDAMQMAVYDDGHRPRALAGDPRWARWVSDRPGGWDEPTAGTFRVSPSAVAAGEWSGLGYRHVVPDPDQWAAVLAGEAPARPPRATLITDFYSYNTDLTAENLGHPSTTAKAWKQANWVGDLTLALRLDVAEARGKFRVGMVKAGVTSRVEIDLATGLATLWHGGESLAGPAASGVLGPGSYDLRVSNVDDRLTLRVNGALPFGEGVSYGQAGDAVAPTAADLAPVEVAAAGASVSVGGLVLTRDLYYTREPAESDVEGLDLERPLPRTAAALFDWLADPGAFAAFAEVPPLDFPIRPGHYLMLGDNSPWSRDGRKWGRADQRDPDDPGAGWDDSGRESWEVPEALVIGKAFAVYWPHLKPFGPAWRFGRDVRLPARPYFEKVRWVR